MVTPTGEAGMSFEKVEQDINTNYLPTLLKEIAVNV